MKTKWPTKKLGEICEWYFSGVWGREPESNTNLAKVIRVSDIKDDFSIDYEKVPVRAITSKDLEKYKLKTGDIVIVKSSGSKNRVISGRAAYFEEQNNQVFIPSNFLLTLRISRNKALPKFVWYFLLTEKVKGYVKGIVEGTTYPNLNISQYLILQIPLPPLPIQQKIVYILDTIQSAIKLQEKIIEKTKELKKSLMAELFKYGGPSFRKGRKLKKTEIGEIPENWEVVRLGEVVIRNDGIKRGPWGGSIKKEIFVEEGYKVYEQGNVIKKNFEIGNYFITEEKFYELRDFEVKPGDILLTAAGSLGQIAIVPQNIKKGIMNQALIRIRLNNEKINHLFFSYLFNHISSIFAKYSHGSTLKNLVSVGELKTLPIPLPPLPEQREIVEILQTIDQKIEIEKKKKELYEELFKTMLNKIMNQEIDVGKINL